MPHRLLKEAHLVHHRLLLRLGVDYFHLLTEGHHSRFLVAGRPDHFLGFGFHSRFLGAGRPYPWGHCLHPSPSEALWVPMDRGARCYYDAPDPPLPRSYFDAPGFPLSMG